VQIPVVAGIAAAIYKLSSADQKKLNWASIIENHFADNSGAQDFIIRAVNQELRKPPAAAADIEARLHAIYDVSASNGLFFSFNSD
jgi:hypothetical protein